MNYQEKKELLIKFRNRQLTVAEQELFFELVKKGEYGHDFEKLLEENDEQQPDIHVPRNSVQNIKEQLHNRINENQRKKSIRLRFMKAAAILLLFIGAGWVFFSVQHHEKAVTLITITVPKGKMYQVKLDDGTMVKLISGSVFRYPEKFAPNYRRVFLDEGNALFDVAHDKARPFTVRSGKLSTTALGTSFTVQNSKAYGWEKVSLYTGKVVVKQASGNGKQNINTTYLTPGQSYQLQGEIASKMGIDNFMPGMDPIADGSLRFNSTPVKEALYMIASYYQVHIHFSGDTPPDYKVNGNFQDQSAEDVLRTLAQMYQLDFKKTSDSTYAVVNKSKSHN